MTGVVSGRGSLRPHGAPYRAVSVARDWRPAVSEVHGKVDVSARAAVHMLGRVCLCAPGPWGHCKAICRCVGASTAVHHTLDHSRAPDFGPFSAKFAASERGFLVCGDGTGRVDA